MATTATKIKNTIAYLTKARAARAAGYPVYLKTDPEWLVDMAIGRRAGWVEDDHAHGITMPVAGRLPKKATGDAQRLLSQLASRVNTPRLVVRETELGEWRGWLTARLPNRFTSWSGPE